MTSRRVFAFERNLVLAASAGTGKTYALVGVAIHLLLGASKSASGGLRPPLSPEALVATTFSRKAAGEIRSRLAEVLDQLADGGTRAPYRRDLDDARVGAGLTPFSDAELATLAQRARAGMGRAKIGTLHSFAGWVVRQHALLLGLSPDFDIPDEETTRERMTHVIEQVLEERAESIDIAALIGVAGGVVPFVDLARRLLVHIAEDGRTSRELELPEGDAAELQMLFERVLGHARDLREDAKLGQAARVVLAGFDANDHYALEEAMGEMWAISKGGKPSPAAAAFFELRDSFAHTSASSRLRDHGRAFVRRWLVRDRILPRAQAMKAFLATCEERIAEANLRDSVLGFADVLRAARDVLRDHPEVARETGAQLGALLVDECQDTSALQRDLILLLWESHGEALRAPGALPTVNDVRPEGLLIVGDRKQSIYAFRGADVAVFAELSVGLAGETAREALAIPAGLVNVPREPSGDFFALRDNRRGEPELLEFANALSRISLVPSRGEAPELYEVSYVSATEDLVAPPPDSAEEAAQTRSARTTRTRWLRLPVPVKKQTTSLVREAEAMSARIDRIVRGGELTVKGAPARWRDIAILAPRHEVLAAATYTLARAGIPHVVAGMGFFGAREVRDVVAMLACLVDPDDSLSRAEVLRGPWAGVTDRTLIGLTDRHAGLVDVSRWGMGERRLLIDVVDRRGVAALARVITTLRSIVGRLGPGVALREAARMLSLEETLILLPRGEQRVANVRKLFEIADAATDGTELLQRLRRAHAREQKEGEAATFSDEDDAVRLLTVHASKGLAFPIVFLPDAGAVAPHRATDVMLVQQGSFGGPARLVTRVLDELGTVHETPSYSAAKLDLSRREAAERRRLRYVATTRASSAMFFVGDRAIARGPSDAYQSSTAGLLARLSADDDSRTEACLEVETDEPRHVVVAETISLHREPVPYRRLPLATPSSGPITLDADALLMATYCVRRVQLREMAAPPAALFASSGRTVAELRARLASAGEWGLRVVREQPRVLADESFVLALGEEDGGASIVVGRVPIQVAWADGTVDVIGFEGRALGDDGLRASMLTQAVRATVGNTTSLRVGFLPASSPLSDEPRWVNVRDAESTFAVLADAARKVLAVSTTSLAPRVAASVCHATVCGYVDACHPRAHEEQPGKERSQGKQTSFDFFEAELRIAPGRGKRTRRRPR